MEQNHLKMEKLGSDVRIFGHRALDGRAVQHVTAISARQRHLGAKRASLHLAFSTSLPSPSHQQMHQQMYGVCRGAWVLFQARRGSLPVKFELTSAQRRSLLCMPQMQPDIPFCSMLMTWTCRIKVCSRNKYSTTNDKCSY